MMLLLSLGDSETGEMINRLSIYISLLVPPRFLDSHLKHDEVGQGVRG